MFHRLFSPASTLPIFHAYFLECFVDAIRGRCTVDRQAVTLHLYSSVGARFLTRALSRCFGVRTGRDGRCS